MHIVRIVLTSYAGNAAPRATQAPGHMSAEARRFSRFDMLRNRAWRHGGCGPTVILGTLGVHGSRANIIVIFADG